MKFYYLLLIVPFVFCGCGTNVEDFKSERLDCKTDPSHEFLSEGLNLSTNLGGGFYEFSMPPVYLVALDENKFKFYQEDPSGEMSGINIESISSDHCVICYMDRRASWTVLSDIAVLLGPEHGTVYLAYNEHWKNQSHVELLEVELARSHLDSCHALQIKLYSNGNIEQFGAYGEFEFKSVFDARVYKSTESKCCNYPVYLVAEPDVTIEDFSRSLNILTTIAQRSVFVEVNEGVSTKTDVSIE